MTLLAAIASPINDMADSLGAKDLPKLSECWPGSHADRVGPEIGGQAQLSITSGPPEPYPPLMRLTGSGTDTTVLRNCSDSRDQPIVTNSSDTEGCRAIV